eukprot:TRINITY_DN8058_c0_g1_i1.p1 TRINITY_DN8058_c0_g1~~TRINITY_DN8058_c0_g1_i1.p1  ORF type:complete len:474 (-),score=160.00 TRINITY_DN8058_c0_g1_i1:362-1783(-)
MDVMEYWPVWKRLVLEPSWVAFYRTFGLVFGIRAALSIMQRLIALARSKSPMRMLSLSELLTERRVVFREQGARLGLFLGGFSGIYTLVRQVMRVHACAPSVAEVEAAAEGEADCVLRAIEERDPVQCHRRTLVSSIAAGAAAGLSLSFIAERETRQTIAMDATVRAIQSLYLVMYNTGKWEALCGTAAKNFLDLHGSALLFAVASAQVMYAYVMRPETLSQSYWKFIVRSGPIPANVLAAARAAADRVPIPSELNVKMAPNATIAPCSVLHSDPSLSCSHFNWNVFKSSCRKGFSVYLPLNAVSYILLGIPRFIRNPPLVTLKMLGSTLQSTVFLAFFITLYQISCCSYRNMGVTRDHKLFYWICGFICSSAIYIERHHRRAELALYVMPRALHSIGVLFFMKRLRLPDVPMFEVLLFSSACAAVMYFRENDPTNLSPFARIVLNFLLPRKRAKKRPTSGDAATEVKGDTAD